MGGSVNEAGMLTLSRLVFLSLSSERRSSFLLRLTFVMPRAQPLQVRRSMIVTRLDVVALGTSCRATRPVMQERFAPAACASTDEGAALIPIGWQSRCSIAR